MFSTAHRKSLSPCICCVLCFSFFFCPQKRSTMRCIQFQLVPFLAAWSFSPLARTYSKTTSSTTKLFTNPVDDNAASFPPAFDPTEGPNAPLILNNKSSLWFPQRIRPRRNRKSAVIRNMVRETSISPANFIYPLFIHDEDFCQDIVSMPGCERHSLQHMMTEIEESVKYGVR